MSELEQIRRRLRHVSLAGGPFDAQQMFNDARDLLVMVDDLNTRWQPMAMQDEDSISLDCSGPLKDLAPNR